jgi:hypothetical protein
MNIGQGGSMQMLPFGQARWLGSRLDMDTIRGVADYKIKKNACTAVCISDHDNLLGRQESVAMKIFGQIVPDLAELTMVKQITLQFCSKAKLPPLRMSCQLLFPLIRLTNFLNFSCLQYSTQGHSRRKHFPVRVTKGR